jgi:septal ring factor EnvC (AmiA/AmiB activator)
MLQWLKKTWEYLLAALGLALAYLTLRPQDTTEAPEKPDKNWEEREEEAKAKQRRAEEAKAEAEQDLKQLRREEDELAEALDKAPQHEDKTKEELRQWLRQNYDK